MLAPMQAIRGERYLKLRSFSLYRFHYVIITHQLSIWLRRHPKTQDIAVIARPHIAGGYNTIRNERMPKSSCHFAETFISQPVPTSGTKGSNLFAQRSYSLSLSQMVLMSSQAKRSL